MPFSADLIQEISSTTLKNHLKKGSTLSQNIQNKPMWAAFDRRSKSFAGGRGLTLSRSVDAGQGGGSVQGYNGDDQVYYYNPTGTKRAEYQGKEHHIGITYTFSELKENGIEVLEDGADQTEVRVSGREEFALEDILRLKRDRMDEDYNRSMDLLLHGDGTADPKAFAGIRSLILDNPGTGTTGGLSRTLNPWWRNRAATAAFGAAGGQGAITSSTANGGALAAFLDTEIRQLKRYGSGTTWTWFAGSAFIDAYKLELRANGYTASDFAYNDEVPDGSMKDPRHAGNPMVYDPTLDDLGLSKRCYVIAMGENDIQMWHFGSQKRRQHHPARPYDRYVVYNGVTTDRALTAYRLRTSAVYDIA
jgi:hypothetical protein